MRSRLPSRGRSTDIATLAIMELRSPGSDRRLDELRRLLDGSDIGAEVLTLEEDDIDDSPNLAQGRSQWVGLAEASLTRAHRSL